MKGKSRKVEVWVTMSYPDGSVEFIEKLDEFDSRKDAVQFITQMMVHSKDVYLEAVQDGCLLMAA